ncbi:hypothetical protein GQ55_3G318800 [Panicum hallii var. hallii]|uniref:Uncharacterized protein n=1 Tax=Panicum hallii var. hallii TaxID=1504633 RepID=A0A2T7EFC8_9POAL|nr:hypothetical protein GQ55_3G318800 [Panicum hallii var. hallii]
MRDAEQPRPLTTAPPTTDVEQLCAPSLPIGIASAPPPLVKTAPPPDSLPAPGQSVCPPHHSQELAMPVLPLAQHWPPTLFGSSRVIGLHQHIFMR